MRATLAVVVCLLICPRPAAAEDPPAEQVAPARATPEAAADAVAAALASGDAEALRARAGQDQPDPWLVAEELLARGEQGAAEAFSTAAPRKAVERLPDYVVAWRTGAADGARRRRLDQASRALEARAWEEVLAILGPPEDPTPPDVLGARLAQARGIAAGALARRAESARAYLRAAHAAAAIGWHRRSEAAALRSASAAFQAGAFDLALEALGLRLRALEALGSRREQGSTLNLMAVVLCRRREFVEALPFYRQAFDIQRGLGAAVESAETLGNLTLALIELQQYSEALATGREAERIYAARGEAVPQARALVRIGLVHAGGGEYAEALATYHRALEVARASGLRAEMAMALNNLGILHKDLGEFARALAFLQEAHAIYDALGEQRGAAELANNLAIVHQALGNYGQSQDLLLATRDLAVKRGDNRLLAMALNNLGDLHRHIGDWSKALAFLREALALKEGMGDAHGALGTLGNIGAVQLMQGRSEEALATFLDALERARGLGRVRGEAGLLCNVGLAHRQLGDHAKALDFLGRALEIRRHHGNEFDTARDLRNLGNVHLDRGEPDLALARFREAFDLMEHTPVAPGRAFALWGMALAHHAAGRWAESIHASRSACEIAQPLIGSLAHEQGATAGERWTGLYTVGARAALRASSTADLAWFLESGRATSLRLALEAREGLREHLIPLELARAETRARRQETAAMAALRKAGRGGSLAEARAARAQLAAAQAAVGEVVARIQRTARRGASIAYPQADTLDAMRARLAPHEALLLYFLGDGEAAALVATREEARIVRLAGEQEIEEAAAALRPDKPGSVYEEAAAHLRALIVDPLALEERTTRVLVSPTGILGYTPFALLLGAREIAYVPSGTTHGILLEEPVSESREVLALGDPEYRLEVARVSSPSDRAGKRFRLVPLPGTRAEVRAVGTQVLLGKEATESGLHAALAGGARWRAVHFACHGLVDAERPMLSSLALTAEAPHDGFLTCLDVFRTRIPADLVVLSACETARGRIYASEGIVGLTRAFMFAGTPRVICSLWKVDDEATGALMVRFYELWNPKDGRPGLGAAAALQAAQAHVRAQGRWKHPYYWSAWVLWGLPD